MGRSKRIVLGGLIYHVINRSNAGMQIFDSKGDYEAFERIMWQASERFGMRILSYCIMPNHWHLILWPGQDGDLSRFMGWLTLTHTQRWHAHRQSVGSGHVYQGRFKSFVVQSNEYFLTVCRYVESNALNAELVKRAEEWQWSSLYRRVSETKGLQEPLADWPVQKPENWVLLVNRDETGGHGKRMLSSLHDSMKRGRPFGDQKWVDMMIDKFGLESTMRPRGRPRIKGS